MNYKYILTTILVMAAFSGTASAWLTGYDYRMSITVDNGGASSLSYYQFNFTNDTNVLVSAGEMQASGADCRITDASDNLLPFWNETPFNATGTKIWVNATTLAVGDNTFYMYYGNAGASSVSNITNTFLFGDDFEDGNFNRWDSVGATWGTTSTTVKSGTYSAECDVTEYEQEGRNLGKNLSLSNCGNISIELDFRINKWTGTGCHKGMVPASCAVYPSGEWTAGLINPYDIGENTTHLKYWRNPSPYYREYPNGKTIELNQWMHVKYCLEYGGNQSTYLDDFNLGDIDLHRDDNTTFNSSMYLKDLRFLGSGGWTEGHDYLWIDNVIVRKYASPEPTATLGAEETGGGGCGAYNITLPAGWSIIGWTNPTASTAHAVGTAIGGNCQYVVDYNGTTGQYTYHNMAGPESEDTFMAERGYGYWVKMSAETLWERDS